MGGMAGNATNGRSARGRPLEPIIGPSADGAAAVAAEPFEVPWLSRHSVELADGHRVGLAVCGEGIPLVVVHGFSAEGVLYAQTLSRLVGMGFKVIAIDTAGHGGTQGLPTGGASLESYTRLLARAIDHLGIRRAVFAGHSMGGRLVTELAASEPERAIGVILIDAIVGDTWDRMVNLFRLSPPLLGCVGAVLAADTLVTVPAFRDPTQAIKLGRLLTPVLVGNAVRPWRMIGPGVSILRSRGTGWMLDRIAERRIPLAVIHGQRDYAIPLATARAAARRGGGELIVVKGAGHSWLLRDPETLPAIVASLLEGRLGFAIRADAADRLGLDLDEASPAEIEAAYYEPDAEVLGLTPVEPRRRHRVRVPRRPRYEWERVAVLAGGVDRRVG